jgi:hypothetical protein
LHRMRIEVVKTVQFGASLCISCDEAKRQGNIGK